MLHLVNELIVAFKEVENIKRRCNYVHGYTLLHTLEGSVKTNLGN